MSGTAFCLANGLFRLNAKWRVKTRKEDKARWLAFRAMLELAQLDRAGSAVCVLFPLNSAHFCQEKKITQ